MSGFGGRNSRELSACNKGKLRVVEKFKGGADGLIRSIGGGSISLWLDSKDINNADGNLTSWSPKEGTEPSQPTEDKKPNFNSEGWIDNGPCVEFDNNGEALVTTTAIDLDGIDKCAVFATIKTGAIDAHTVVWEYGAQFSLNHGFILGFVAPSGVPLVGSGQSTVNYKTGNASRANETFCFGGVVDRSRTKPDEIDIYVNGVLEPSTLHPSSHDMVGNFNGAQGSWIGARNDGADRPMDGLLREFIIIEGSALREQQAWLMSKALNYKAKIT